MNTPKLATDADDDPHFAERVQILIENVLKQTRPRKLYVLKINNWFDHKWLDFSHVVLPQAGAHRKPPNVPPFAPNRVLSQTTYELHEGGDYRQTETAAVHVWQNSSQNRHRRIAALTDSGLFIWYSGNTARNQNGSVMVYSQSGADTKTWYASLEKRTGWEIQRTKNIPIDDIRDLIA